MEEKKVDFKDGRSVLEARLMKRVNAGRMTDYCIFRCITSDLQNVPASIKAEGGKAYVTVLGMNLPEIEGCLVKYYGKWEKPKNPKYKELQFKAESYDILTPDTEKGMLSFLSGKTFPGIGKKTAERIIEMFGMKCLDHLEPGDNSWLKVKGITIEKLGICRDSYSRNKAYGAIVTALAPYGISATAASKILRKFGPEALERIKKDPFCLMEIRGIGFKQADAVARGLGVALDSYKRVRACAIDTIKKECATTGDMYIEYKDLLTALMKNLNAGIEAKYRVEINVVVEKIQRMIKEQDLIGRGDIDAEDPAERRKLKYVYLQEYDRAEYVSAQRLLQLRNSGISEGQIRNVRAALDEYLATSDKKLSKNQQAAVIRSLSSRISIITGGPGTGKTTIVSAILYCYEHVFGGEETLMAPTGRAAGRMSESTGRPTSTIHSRLKLYEIDGVQVEPQPIESGLVIVDETSMVDNLLLESLLTAIDTDRCHVIFVGDIDQLPSVGVGACLGEMINSGVIPTSRLTEIFRQKNNGGNIVGNAAKINRGEADLEWDNNSFMFCGVNSEDKAIERILAAYKYAVDKYGSHEVALLSPLRQAKSGHKCVADVLNGVIQSEVNPSEAGKPECSLHGITYRLGDRVMQWTNCESSANGDVGDITSIKQDDDGNIHIEITWDNGKVHEYDNTDMETIKLAYAISIHKSQGSEYCSVIIPMLSCQDNFLFKRNLLYTGVTRAKKQIIIIGDKKAIETTSARTDTGMRKTMLAKRLQYNANHHASM